LGNNPLKKSSDSEDNNKKKPNEWFLWEKVSHKRTNHTAMVSEKNFIIFL
jgi:hypothetical protein